MVRILIALDGSEHSEQALLHGTALANAFESELILVRVLATEETGVQSAIDPLDWQLHRCQVQAYLERRTEEITNTGLNARWILEEGRVAERLIRCAERVAAHMIILGAVGRSGIGPFERGGTTQKVISAARTSVLIAPPATQTKKITELHYERILVPVDGSCGSQWALKIAAGIAEVHGSKMLLVQAIEKPELLSPMANTRRARELQEEIISTNRLEAERNLSSLKAKLPTNLHVTSLALVTSNIPDTINEIANQRHASLVVLSAHSDTHMSDWHYGSLPEFLLSHARCPVLVFQHSSAEQANNFHSTYLAETQVNVG